MGQAQGEDGKQLVTGTIIVRSDVLKNNKEAVDTFLQEYEASINYINENVAEGAELVAQMKSFHRRPLQKRQFQHVTWCSSVEMLCSRALPLIWKYWQKPIQLL